MDEFLIKLESLITYPVLVQIFFWIIAGLFTSLSFLLKSNHSLQIETVSLQAKIDHLQNENVSLKATNLKLEEKIAKKCEQIKNHESHDKKFQDYKFDTVSGAYIHKNDPSLAVCPSCKTKNIFSEMRNELHGFRCMKKDCEKWCSKHPDRPNDFHEPYDPMTI